MAIDVERTRFETPGCAHVLHFNNAGASLMPQPVIEAYTSHIQLEARIGGYEAADAAREHRERTYQALAELIGAGAEEIALVDSATRAWNMGFYGLPFNRGDRILTSSASYASNFIAFLHRARTDDLRIDVVPSDDTGQIDLEALDRMSGDGAALVALTHVPTNGGLVNPSEEVGRITRRHGIPFLLDACQSVGQMPIDVDRLKCDVLSATGRKFLRGPRGTGFLYVRTEFLSSLDTPTPDLHSADWVSPREYRQRDDARRFELWESNIAADIALGAAADYALELGMEEVWQRVRGLAAHLRGRLGELPGVTVRDVGRVMCGIVTFTVDGARPVELRSSLRKANANVSISQPNATLLDAESRSLPPMIRASVHYFNTENEIYRFCELLQRVSSGRT